MSVKDLNSKVNISFYAIVTNDVYGKYLEPQLSVATWVVIIFLLTSFQNFLQVFSLFNRANVDVVARHTDPVYFPNNIY